MQAFFRSVQRHDVEKLQDNPLWKQKTINLLKEMYRYRVLYLMVLPGLIAIFIFHYVPVAGVQIAFKDYNTKLGIWGSEWVGLKHFKNFVNYPYFWNIIRNTLWISVVSLFTFPFPLIMALMFNEMKNQKLKKVCQTITYAPYFVSVVVVCSMVSLFLQRDGLINILLGVFGVAAENWLANPKYFALIYAVSGLWSTLGWDTIIYMATLSGVSPELIDAAKIDGANRMQVIWNVNIPQLKPTIITLFILKLGSMMSIGFEKVFLLQNPMNLDVSSIISTYTYEVGIVGQQFSYSTAIGLFNCVVNLILVITANKISQKVSGSGLW